MMQLSISNINKCNHYAMRNVLYLSSMQLNTLLAISYQKMKIIVRALAQYIYFDIHR